MSIAFCHPDPPLVLLQERLHFSESCFTILRLDYLHYIIHYLHRITSENATYQYNFGSKCEASLIRLSYKVYLNQFTDSIYITKESCGNCWEPHTCTESREPHLIGYIHVNFGWISPLITLRILFHDLTATLWHFRKA